MFSWFEEAVSTMQLGRVLAFVRFNTPGYPFEVPMSLPYVRRDVVQRNCSWKRMVMLR